MKRHNLVIAVIGRPNVGKSSLTNRIIGRREAIVHDMPGVTRDRNYYETDWQSRGLTIIDTGGIYNDLDANNSIEFQRDIEDQVRVAMGEADAIIFVVDGKTGMHHLDNEVAMLLRKSKIKIYLAVNKMETNKRDLDSYDFYNLGMESFYPISAITGMGVADLLDTICEDFKLTADHSEKIDNAINVAIVGKPNAGKSSLLNTIIGKERAIVSPIAGTTRDALDEEVVRNGINYRFIDTAGIRRKARVTEDVEYYSVMRSIRAIEKCDIAILLLDAEKLVEEQDQRIAGLIEQNHKGCLIVVNKWDIIEKDSATILRYEEAVRNRLKFLHYCPVLFISAKENIRTYDLYAMIATIYENYKFRTSTSALNTFIREITTKMPPLHKGRTGKIFYATQGSTEPPTFIFFCNNKDLIHFSYRRHMENKLREQFNLYGVPLIMSFRSKTKTKKDREREREYNNRGNDRD